MGHVKSILPSEEVIQKGNLEDAIIITMFANEQPQSSYLTQYTVFDRPTLIDNGINDVLNAFTSDELQNLRDME